MLRRLRLVRLVRLHGLWLWLWLLLVRLSTRSLGLRLRRSHRGHVGPQRLLQRRLAVLGHLIPDVERYPRPPPA